MCYIPDPMELMEMRMDLLEETYVDEHTCMGCGKKVDYELTCAAPTGIGLGLCEECVGGKEVPGW